MIVMGNAEGFNKEEVQRVYPSKVIFIDKEISPDEAKIIFDKCWLAMYPPKENAV